MPSGQRASLQTLTERRAVRVQDDMSEVSKNLEEPGARAYRLSLCCCHITALMSRSKTALSPSVFLNSSCLRYANVPDGRVSLVIAIRLSSPTLIVGTDSKQIEIMACCLRSIAMSAELQRCGYEATRTIESSYFANHQPTCLCLLGLSPPS